MFNMKNCQTDTVFITKMRAIWHTFFIVLLVRKC